MNRDVLINQVKVWRPFSRNQQFRRGKALLSCQSIVYQSSTNHSKPYWCTAIYLHYSLFYIPNYKVLILLCRWSSYLVLMYVLENYLAQFYANLFFVYSFCLDTIVSCFIIEGTIYEGFHFLILTCVHYYSNSKVIFAPWLLKNDLYVFLSMLTLYIFW